MEEPECQNRINKILDSNNILQNPLLKSFLDEQENYMLFKKAILEPNQENKDKVEELFKIHYEKVRLNAYFNKLLKNFAIDFDKKVRKLQQRFSLTLDSIQDVSPVKNLSMDLQINGDDLNTPEGSLKEEIGDVTLSKALESLTKTQYKILELIYVRKLTNLEVAKLLDSSPQNISNLHRKAIKKLKNEMEGKKNGKTNE